MQNSQLPQRPGAIEADRRGGYLFAALVFVLVWLVLCWPWLSGRVTVPWDAKAHFYPQFVFLARALAAGQSPFWSPNVFDGWPQIADPQSLIFAPIYILAALLDPAPGFRLADGLLFGMLALGASGVFLYARDRGWRAEGALVAATAFAFGGSAAWRIQHVGQVMSLAWFPLALFALSRALERRSAAWGAAAGILAGFMVIGRDQVAWLQTLVLVGFVLHRLFGPPGFRVNLRGFPKPLLAGAIGGVLVAGLPVAFTLALAADSNRPELVFSEVIKGSLPPAGLLTMVAPNLFGTDGPLALFWGPPSDNWGPTGLVLARNMSDIYMGALVLVALAAAGVRLRGGDRDARFFAAAALVLLLYALGRYTPVFSLLFHLPGADLWRRPADATFPLCAALAYLAGHAVHRLSSGQARWRAGRTTAILAIPFFVALSLVLAKGRIDQAAGPLVMAALALGGGAALLAWIAARQKAQPHLALALLGLFCAVDLGLGNGPNESTALPPAKFEMLRPHSTNTTVRLLRERLAATAAPDRRDRVELAGLGFDWPNATLSQGFDHDLGYNPLRLSLFERFTAAEDTVGLPEQRTFSQAFPSYRSVAADLTGLRFIATGVPVETIDPSLKPGDLKFLARTADAYIYENPRAMPRVFVATTARAADFDAILRTGAWPDVDYGSTVLLAAAGDQSSRRAGSARLLDYGTTRVDVAASAPDGGWLVLTDIWHPWWECRLDGAPAPIERADVAFRAVRLPPGAHRLEFRFRPFTALWRAAVTRVAQALGAP